MGDDKYSSRLEDAPYLFHGASLVGKVGKARVADDGVKRRRSETGGVDVRHKEFDRCRESLPARLTNHLRSVVNGDHSALRADRPCQKRDEDACSCANIADAPSWSNPRLSHNPAQAFAAGSGSGIPSCRETAKKLLARCHRGTLLRFGDSQSARRKMADDARMMHAPVGRFHAQETAMPAHADTTPKTAARRKILLSR